MPHTVHILKLEQRFLREQVDILLRHLPGIVAGTALLASGTAWLLILRGQPTTKVLGWLAVMVLYSTARLGLYAWHRRHPVNGANAQRWASLLSVVSGGAGLIWGSIALLFFTPEDPYTLAIVAAVLCGILEALVEHLTQAKEQAEASERHKTRFLAAASHDLRQPIHAMSLFVPALQGLVRQAQPSRQALADIADRMHSVLGSMGQLLRVLMEMSRLDSGAVTVRRGPCAINPVLLQVCEVLREQAKAKGLRLRLVESDLWVMADSAVLHTVLLNLVGNAVRYSERGGVLVATRRRGDEVEIQIWDTGIGIPEPDLRYVFDEFYQASNAHRASAQSHGFGLGLSIVQRSAELLGARLDVRSRLARGSVFSVFLPRCEPVIGNAFMQRTSAPSVPAQVVLVLDNDEQIVRALTHLLVGWGHEVLGAQDMDGAWCLTMDHARSISLCIVDYHLNEATNGLQAIGLLRRGLGRGIPALMITGDAGVRLTDEDILRGVTLLNKPVDTRALQRWIAGAAPSTAAID